MKKFILLTLFYLPIIAFCFARTNIVVISAEEIASQSGSLNDAVTSLAGQGYGILHYDRHHILAIAPEIPNTPMIEASFLSEYPPAENIYLVGKIPGFAQESLDKAGKVLWEMDAAYVLESGLGDLELQGVLRNPCARLSLEPIRLSSDRDRISLWEADRSVITNLVSTVSADSILVRLQGLQDLQTRYAMAENRLQVAQWIQQRFLDLGIADVDLQPFTYQSTTQYNVVATIPGTTYPNEYVIVGGHHDSRSNDTNPLAFAPGADDNGSGTAATLEMARVLAQNGYQPKCSIRFVTFAAEEFGLWGSKFYAQDALNAGQSIRLMINHDMIANEPDPEDWQVRLMPYDGSYAFSDYATQLTEQFTNLDAYYGSLNSGSSDSYPFWQRGYHAIYFFESVFSPYYHSSQDIIANCNPAYCADVIKASLACAVAFADQPAVPTAPEGLAITRNGMDFQITWSAVTESVLGALVVPSGYNVYASSLPDGDFMLLGTTPNLFFNYTPTDPEPDRLFFKVQAVLE